MINVPALQILRGQWLNDYGVCRDTIGSLKRQLNAMASHDEFATMQSIVCKISMLKARQTTLMECVTALNKCLEE